MSPRSRPLPDALPRVFAHRCGGALAPENTLAGLRLAARLGLRAVEFDVMLSADATPWLIHDETLERTTNGRGAVSLSPDSLLQTLDAGRGHHPAFAGEPLPTLSAAARLCRQLGLFANVEIKPARGFEALTGEVVARQILALWRGAPPLVSSFSLEALDAARAAAPQLPRACLWQEPPADCFRQLEVMQAFSLHCAADALRDDLLEEAGHRGIPVLCYTVNAQALARDLWARGVAAVFSDRIDALVDSEPAAD